MYKLQEYRQHLVELVVKCFGQGQVGIGDTNAEIWQHFKLLKRSITEIWLRACLVVQALVSGGTWNWRVGAETRDTMLQVRV